MSNIPHVVTILPITMIMMSLEGWGKHIDKHSWQCFTRNRHKGRITGGGWGDGSILGIQNL